MVRLFVFEIASFSGKIEPSNSRLTLEELASHVGDSVTVNGKIYSLRYLESAKNNPTFINVGSAFPNQLLTIVIWGDVRKMLNYAPDEKPYINGSAKVSGKVELYRGKPQIVVTNPWQLSILYDAKVPASQVPPIERKQ